METFHADLVPELPRLNAIARRLCRDPEDLVQETIARALRFQSAFRVGSDLRAWLTRILFNLHAGERRRGARYARARAAYAVEPHGQVVEPSVAAELRGCCPRFAAQDLELIVRVDFDGYTYAEVATDLHVPIGTVMSRLFRARRRVKDAMSDMPAQRRGASSGATSSAPVGTPSSRTIPRSSARKVTTRPSARPMRAVVVGRASLSKR